MMKKPAFKSLNLFLLSTAMISSVLSASLVSAQQFKDLKSSSTPLTLQAQGSFYVGGEKVEQTQVELGSFGPAGTITVNQMYVRYMIPVKSDQNISMVLIHGMTLTGKTWETTPDGRMGWDEYFVRKGYPVYVVDQVSRGRSGFNQAAFNNVHAGIKSPSEQPAMWRFGDEGTWPNFRFGLKENAPFPDGQFPVAALSELSRQAAPDVAVTFATPNPNYKDLSELSIHLQRTVLISHSQSGSFPLETALLNSTGIAGAVLMEPGRCRTDYNEQQIKTLSTFPILVVFGDYLDIPTGIPGHSWKASYDGCKTLIAQVNNAGGKAQMFYLPEQGVKGNSHMLMQDKNNLQIADMIEKWMDENINKGKSALLR